MSDKIGKIFNEVIAIFGVDEKDADKKGLWEKFEKSLKEILYDPETIMTTRKR